LKLEEAELELELRVELLLPHLLLWVAVPAAQHETAAAAISVAPADAQPNDPGGR
jgi:hypothetical protein